MGLWKAIKHKWQAIKSRSHFLLGNGRKAKFWKDLWCKDQTLKEVFLNLFSMASCPWKHLGVESLLSSNSKEGDGLSRVDATYAKVWKK